MRSRPPRARWSWARLARDRGAVMRSGTRRAHSHAGGGPRGGCPSCSRRALSAPVAVLAAAGAGTGTWCGLPPAASAELLMVGAAVPEVNEDACAGRRCALLPPPHSTTRQPARAGGRWRSRPGKLTWLAGSTASKLLGSSWTYSPLAAADAVVVPLRRGAGLKFKTVEALSAGVPAGHHLGGGRGRGPGRRSRQGMRRRTSRHAVLTVLRGTSRVPGALPPGPGGRCSRPTGCGVSGGAHPAVRGRRPCRPRPPRHTAVARSAAANGTAGQTVEPWRAPENGPRSRVVVPVFNAAATIGGSSMRSRTRWGPRR
ncbi:hypothetical protein QJS66_07655 [Kocuria rhizophila]|nr:hypothetical protein QJS66_07655 [Kocuria rhizophila]